MGEMLLAMPPKGISLLPLSNFPPLQDLQPHAWLAQLGERRSTEREVAGSNPGRTNTQGL